MDAENPTSLRRLLLHVAATLLALVVMYVLSAGPAEYFAVKFKPDSKVLTYMYAPLDWVTTDPPLQQPYIEYILWWARLAESDPDK